MTITSFIAAIAPIAVRLRLDGSPIFPSVRIAQAGLETGWSIPPWNNLGGYKVGSGMLTPYWRGEIVNKGTWEMFDGKRVNVTAAFRAYDTVEDFFRDQDLLFQLPRYARVRAAKSPEEQAEALRASGYATDPTYAQKLIHVIHQYGLKKYDEEVQQAMEEMIQLREEIASLRKENEVLRNQLGSLLEVHSMNVPDWAKEAVEAAVRAKLIDTPEGGSFDFYRMVTILHRAGLIPIV